jgi:ATP-dependent DNA helicase RecG
MTLNQQLLDTILKHGKECEWIEFKKDNSDPVMIGKNISALANSTALLKKPFGYLVWGIDDTTLEKIGTNFDPSKIKVGGMELEHYLNQNLDPKTNFSFVELEDSGQKFVIIKVTARTNQPIKFGGVSYIRIGSNTTELKNYPEKERELWAKPENSTFATNIAMSGLTEIEVMTKLDTTYFFSRIGYPTPSNAAGIMDKLTEEGLIVNNDTGYDITNLGAILLARDLNEFSNLRFKGIRVVKYKGTGKIELLKDYELQKGYAYGFDELINYIQGNLPSKEVIDGAYRKTVADFPELLLRELLANAMMHQDFLTSGTVIFEIFDGRIQITNPGSPLIDLDRIINSAPKCRNEPLSKMMRRLKLCEELGTGIDKVIKEIEKNLMPPIRFEDQRHAVRVTVYAPKDFKDLNLLEKTQAVYQHVCVNYELGVASTNASIRERFGLDKHYNAQISRLIANCVESGLIKLEDTGIESSRYNQYIPHWS